MSPVINAWLVPHPPIVIPAVGAGRERPARATITALQEMAAAVCAAAPDVLIVLTPHGEAARQGHVVSTVPVLQGNMARFGAPGCRLSFDVALSLAKGILSRAVAAGVSVRADATARALDHGAFVPLYFLHQAGCQVKLVHIAVGDPMAPGNDAFGAAIRAAVLADDVRAALIVSGDLSHRLAHDGPYGYSDAGMAFEQEMDRLMRAGDLAALDRFSARDHQEAAQCGVGPLKIARGALSAPTVRVLSHEWPFGVGYMVAELKGGEDHA